MDGGLSSGTRREGRSQGRLNLVGVQGRAREDCADLLEGQISVFKDDSFHLKALRLNPRLPSLCMPFNKL